MKNYSEHSKNLIIIIGVALIVILAISLGTRRNKLNNKNLIFNSIKELNLEAKFINSNKWLVVNPLTDLEESYIYIGEGKGYNGPIKVLVLSDTNHVIKSVKILAQSETHSYFQLIIKNDFLKKITGKPLNSVNDIDGISGATRSSVGIISGINSAYSLGENLDFSENKKIQFGVLEILILILFTLALINTKLRKKQYVQIVWWLSLFLSIIFLGFAYNQPITLARINSLLLGFWPSVYTELFVYILITGSILSIVFTGKNHYCHSICPYGASQELIGKLGNAKIRKPKNFKLLKKAQWSITFIAVVIALFMYNPGITEYEIYGGLFKLTATAVGFGLLIIVLISSLFIKKPWCRYLCPLHGFFRYFLIVRKEIIRLFK